MNYKKWSIRILIAWILVITIIGVSVIIVDPYYHFHKPLKGLTYEGGNATYSNNGILRNFDYEALIIGTSMTSGFSEDEASEMFGEKFVRTTFLGEGFYILNQNMKTALNHQPKLHRVIRSIDTLWFVTDSDWTAMSDYPDYLYDDSKLNDVKYLYNIDVWHEAMIPTITASIMPNYGSPENPKSDDTRAEKYLNDGNALSNYKRADKMNTVIDPNETKMYYQMMDSNLSSNLLDTIGQYPDVTFDLFFPPYSVLWWDSINQAGPGRVDRKVDMEQYAIEKILKYKNVHLYSFTNNYDLTCNLDNYSDSIHYKPAVNSEILRWIHNGEYELTEDNYKQYINDIRTYYTTYDYDGIFDDMSSK